MAEILTGVNKNIARIVNVEQVALSDFQSLTLNATICMTARKINVSMKLANEENE